MSTIAFEEATYDFNHFKDLDVTNLLKLRNQIENDLKRVNCAIYHKLTAIEPGDTGSVNTSDS